MSVADAVNRGYNVLAATVLLVIGLGFTELIFGEPDPLDKIDNSILLAVGIVAVAWYFSGNHRYQRSPVPIVLGGVALAGQLLGIFIEIGDPKAIGDDFGGLNFYIATVIALVVVYSVNRRLVT
jgi:hypothetical protein